MENGGLDSILIEKSMVINDKLITSYTIYIGNITGEWGLAECSRARAPTYRGSTVSHLLLEPIFVAFH